MQVVINDSVYNQCDPGRKVEVYLKSSKSFSYDPNLFNLLKLSPDVLAKQITLHDVKQFKTIPTSELYSRGWEKKEAEKLKLIPNVFQFTTQFNRVSYWVAGEILKECTPKLRADKIAHFLKMARCLDDLQNYHSLVAIVMGMNLNAIFRLHATWDLVSKRDKAVFKGFVDLSSNNWKTLKELLEDVEVPAVPHLGIYLQQISGINSHPKYSKEEKEAKVEAIVMAIQRLQCSHYNIIYVNHIQEFLMSEKYILEMQKFHEENILKLSFEREPMNKLPLHPSPKGRCHHNSKSLEDFTLVNPLHEDLDRSTMKSSKGFKRGHRKTHSLSVLEGFNSDQERAGTALLLDSPESEKALKLPTEQNLIDDSWQQLQRNRSISEPPNVGSPRSVTVNPLDKIHEVRIEGVLLKKTCQKLGRQPKIRRWKAFYCLVSEGKLFLYTVKGYQSSSGMGQSSTLKKSIKLESCTVTISPDLKHDNVFTIADVVGNIYKFKDNIKWDAPGWVAKIEEEKKHRSDLMLWD